MGSRPANQILSQEQGYQGLYRFSSEIKISPERLLKAFEIEKEFHERILNEPEYQKRQKLYKSVYETVHKIYGKKNLPVAVEKSRKERLVRLFRKELEGKAILDVGCGNGAFLCCIAENLMHKKLVGIDISTPVIPGDTESVGFIEGDIIDLEIDDEFDVVFSDNVLEHIAPADLPRHLKSVRRVLRKGGKFIILMPNRLFGPADVT